MSAYKGVLEVMYFAYRDVIARNALLRYLAAHAEQVCSTNLHQSRSLVTA